ncbi:hypothetical protein [Streptomyces sp. NPDC127108]|uniref:hypothetical protein n=1 Tax=Streptomyces sp. NPDC127108 TaxID=3345361 RepID=UPI00362D5B7A
MTNAFRPRARARDRRAEQAWAAAHRDAFVLLTAHLAAVPDLQQRADTCPRGTRANQVTALHARRAGEPDPQPIRTGSPRR